MTHILEVFVSEHCIGCPYVREQVRRFAEARPDVRVVEHDIDRHPESAARYGLFATPAIVIDGRKVLYGIPNMSGLAAWCGASD